MAHLSINIRRVFVMYAIAIAVIILSSIIGYYIGPYVMSQSLAYEIANEVKGAAVSPIYIFAHNLLIATLMILPFIGPLAFIGSLSFTGFFLGDLIYFTLKSPIGLLIAILVTLFLPHGIIEIMAYAFAMSGSLNLTLGIVRRHATRNDVIAYLIYYILAVVLLFVAANVEYWELTTLKGFISSALTT